MSYLLTPCFRFFVNLFYWTGALEAARVQIQRIATVRSLNINQVEMLVAKNTDGRFIGIFGEPGVNVLKLNLALDGLQ